MWRAQHGQQRDHAIDGSGQPDRDRHLLSDSTCAEQFDAFFDQSEQLLEADGTGPGPQRDHIGVVGGDPDQQVMERVSVPHRKR